MLSNTLKEACKVLGYIILGLALVVVVMILLVLGFQGGVVIHDHIH